MFARAGTTLICLCGLVASGALADEPEHRRDTPATGPAAVLAEVHRAADGRIVTLQPPSKGATVLYFYSRECPISNYFSATMNGLVERYGESRVRWVGVCVDPDSTPKAQLEHAREYKLAFPVTADPRGRLAREVGVRVTPEVVVFNDAGEVAYRGRIDDQYAARTVKTTSPRTHELADAVKAVLAGRVPAAADVPAVGCPLPDPPSAPDRVVSYTRDVAPIVFQNCLECHRSGHMGPFALETYEQARKRSADLAAVAADRLMPPYRARPTFGQRFLHDRSLATDEIATLAAWSDAGAPEGDPADLPARPAFSDDWAMGPPDLVIEMPEPFTIPADGGDIYRCFVIPTDLGRDAYVSGIEYKPGNGRVVHHILGYVDTSGEALKRDEAEPGPGYTCFSGPGVERIRGDLGGWAPGVTAAELPEGLGRPLPDKAHVIMQVHYHPNGKEETDRSRIGLYLAKKPVKQAFHWSWVMRHDLQIPPGDSHYEVVAGRPLPLDVLAYSVAPHMHLLGKDMTMWAELPDGSRIDLIDIDHWDFKWQNQYYLERPVKLPKGTVLKLQAHFDNSSDNPNNPNRESPQEVRWGEATTDEMCIGFIGLVRDGQDLTQPGQTDDLREILDRQEQEARERAREKARQREQQRNASGQ
jgi:hypothetical protein